MLQLPFINPVALGCLTNLTNLELSGEGWQSMVANHGAGLQPSSKHSM